MKQSVEASLRTFTGADEHVVVDLWNATYTRDPISAKRFKRQTLGDPNFSPEGCWLVEVDGKVAGFAVAVAPGVQHVFARPAGVGRITALGVLPSHQRRGLGTILLERALSFLKERDCRRVVVAAHEYYVAGIDRDAYPGGLAFLTSKGFAEVGDAVAMGRMLYDLDWPQKVREGEAALSREGVVVKYVEPQDREVVKGFFQAEFATWVEFYQRKLDDGDELDDIVIAKRGDQVLGYCQRLEADHVGPFGVAEAWRNRGIGGVMLYRLLERMQQKGYRFAWFGETGRAQPYYERAGFKLTRRYAVMAKEL